MIAHTHTVITPGCYRCELNLDEMQAIASECLVTRSGVVHYDDCAHVSHPHSTAVRWIPANGWGGPMPTDRPCSRCMTSGLPVAVPA